MNSPDDLPSLQRAARRKLVRGVFAAPAIMTVCSGSALATTSSMRCLSNQVTGNPMTLPVSNALDNYCRVRLWETGTSPSVAYWIKGADLQVYKRTNNTVYISSTDWQQFNITTNQTGATQGAAPVSCIQSSKYAVVRFNAAGNVVGVGATPTGSSAVAGTCWASFLTTL